MVKFQDSCYLDANCLIYFNQKRSSFHGEAVSILASILKRELIPIISCLTLDEFLYNISGTIEQKTIDLERILRIPSLKIVNSPSDFKNQLFVTKLMQKFKLSPRDAYHLLNATHNKAKFFVTFDHDFEKVFESKLIKKFLI